MIVPSPITITIIIITDRTVIMAAGTNITAVMVAAPFLELQPPLSRDHTDTVVATAVRRHPVIQ